MKTLTELYESIISEATNPDDFEVKQDDNRELFIGRLQPVHKGHQAIIDMMKKPVVVVVKGKKSSEDKTRNPFDAKQQEKWIKKLNPKAVFMTYPTGYIPEIINELRKDGIEIDTILAGDDRIGGYEGQIKGFNSKMPEDKQIDVKFKATPRITSASKIRSFIIDGDEESFQKWMPKKLWSEFDKMSKIINR